MQLPSFPITSVIFFLCVLQEPSRGQQEYYQPSGDACNSNTSVSKGYFCNGLQRSCRSFVTYHALPPYDTPLTIATLLGSDPVTIASVNNVPHTRFNFQPYLPIIVPITCSCSGSIYQQNTPYIATNASETYSYVVNQIYQGLTTCEALRGQNYYQNENLTKGAELNVPLRCACPSPNQTANGVASLLTYTVAIGENLTFIAGRFDTTIESVVDANTMASPDFLAVSVSILVPLKNESCTAKPKYFLCHCPDGRYAYETEAGHLCEPVNKDGQGFPVKLLSLLGFGIGITFLSLVLLCYHLYKYLKKRKNKIRQEKFFKQNGGFLLQQHFSSYGSSDRTKLFSEDELQRATDNYNECRILGQGGYGTVYKGMLLDGGIVAIKRSKVIDRSQINQFVNEIVILSQINHRNVVKVLGCCLEAEFPILVYEYISNGTLAHHIHERDQESSLSWEDRFRVAAEVAGAIAYMHSAASTPIYHRDIKSSNILLDDKYCAKVSDFGTSRSVPFEKTHLTTAVQGTFGYLDPEYFQSGQFTEKSDVYSFGVVLIELLTGQKPISFTRAEEERNLVAYFSSAKEERLFQILDPRVAREAGQEDIKAIADLAIRCVRLSGKRRPTMKEVALELEALRKCQRSLQISRSSQQLDVERTSGHTAASESMKEYMDDSFGITIPR